MDPNGLPPLRIGIGHDTHRLKAGGPLRLGGIDIPHDAHAVGHSDADVLLHAATDALLGAAALGDIGELFPDTDPAHRGRDSGEMLRAALAKVQAAGWSIANLDCIVFAELPKLTPYKAAIRQRLGELLGVSPECVGLKAKTAEGQDAVGRREAIAAQCVALLLRRQSASEEQTMTMTAASPSAPASSKSPAALRLYSTLTRTMEPLVPVKPGQIGMYLCGPTVYKPSHIGHMVGPVIFDAIKRYLTYCGYKVTWVVNVTDVDDKLIVESRNRQMKMADLATEMTADYMRNLAAMGVDSIDHFPKATENMDEIIRFTQTLVERGFAYVSEGDVYFDVGRDPDYGKLSRRTLDSLQGEGGDMAERKRSPADFALWKSAKPGEPSWKSPWGEGRPGWHIECSAMSRRILGETFDIHGGGLDLIFPHHENEIAQSECCHGRPQAKYWLHNGLMQSAGEAGKVGGRPRGADGDAAAPAAPASAAKISKSTGASPFSELLQRHQPETIRFFLLSTHYRSPIQYSEELLAERARSLDAFYRFFKRYERITGRSFFELKFPATREAGESAASSQPWAELRSRFLEAMDDDFNTGAAVARLFDLVSEANKFADAERLEVAAQAPPEKLASLEQAAATLRELSATLGLFRKPVETKSSADDSLLPPLMELLIELRAGARKAKDFATADKIRKRLVELGITLEDRPGGTEWTRK